MRSSHAYAPSRLALSADRSVGSPHDPAPKQSTPGARIRVLIGESNPFVRIGLATLLGDEPDLEVCGLYATEEDARLACERLTPDVVLIDRPLASRSTIRAIRSGCAGAVLVFLDRLHEHEVFEMMSSGVSGLLVKRDDPDLLCEAIRAVARGEDVWLSPRVSRLLLPPNRRSGANVGLSERERTILQAMAAGQSNTEIADEHCLSPGTVRNVVSALYSKLGVTCRAGAIAWAWRCGLAQPSGEEAPRL